MRFQELKTNKGEFCGVLDLETGHVLFNTPDNFSEDARWLATEFNKQEIREMIAKEHNQRLQWFAMFVDCVENIGLNCESESSWVQEVRYNDDREILYVSTQQGKMIELYDISWEEYMGVYEKLFTDESIGSYIHELKNKHRYS